MTGEHRPPGAGRGSFEMVDRERLFRELAIGPSTVFLDLGCGRGDYTIAAAELIGPKGRLYAVDAWEEGLFELKSRASRLGVSNIETFHSDLRTPLPLPAGSVDICLMATVLHDLLQEGPADSTLGEIVRVLRPDGRLAIVEFKKEEDGLRPPLYIRISEGDVEEVVGPFGFLKERVSEIGERLYLFLASR